MLKILSSLSFLYCLSILVLIVYGFIFYKGFSRSAKQRKQFPLVFGIISFACLAFLWLNFHAPISLQTISNTDHHFIRHDGFLVTRKIELGRSDTLNFPNNPYNSFIFSQTGGKILVTSNYSEEPLYSGNSGKFSLVSPTHPASPGHSITYNVDGFQVKIQSLSENDFELAINETQLKISRDIRKGITLWNLFKDDLDFINSDAYRSEFVISSLNGIFFVRNDVNRKTAGELRFFVSSKLFTSASDVKFDSKNISVSDIRFNASLNDDAQVAWGISFLDNNKNQLRLSKVGTDSFRVLYKYPVSYPLTEETNTDWSVHTINKFLISDSKDMLKVPAVFRQGFLFEGFPGDKQSNFDPLLLSYEKNSVNEGLKLQARRLETPTNLLSFPGDNISLSSRSNDFQWLFSIPDTYEWQLGGFKLSPFQWQAVLFGSLLLFIVLILLTSLIKPASKLSWVWQIMACLTVVLLTTRFFFYWRYKTFPPYEGMDLPSVQQLNSFWNFGIIILTTIILAIIFGFGFFRWLAYRSSKLLFKQNSKLNLLDVFSKNKFSKSLLERFGAKRLFLGSWGLVILVSAGIATVSGFDPGICRHLAIGLVICYFIFSMISYRYSPLVISQDKSWWTINTSSKAQVLFNNPVKALLSLTMLGLLVFVDIGFAIVFLNFLLFNETFLCINYSISGLSSGSKRNAGMFGLLGLMYLVAFVGNLVYAPYIFSFVLNLHTIVFLTLYVFMAMFIMAIVIRIFPIHDKRRKLLLSIGGVLSIFLVSFFFFPKEKILSKAAMTKYRIDVMTMPVDKAIETAYVDGKTWQPVIRAAQNQWFINTFIEEENNPGSGAFGFQLLPHAPQTKGAKYNAQATDLVASRFFLAEHGAFSVLLFVLLLLLPVSMLASFYKIYPDFSNRINSGYPFVTTGFSILNYLLVTALLVILAATGRYIFFGQDLPFGSILSKQSVIFPSLLIIFAVMLFKAIPLEYYANRKKLIPGASIFVLLAFLLFFVNPGFNRDKEFNVPQLATNLESQVALHLQPVMDYFDTSRATRRFSFAKKDGLFTDSLRKMIVPGEANSFFAKEITAYSRTDFNRHLDQNRMIYLDLYSGTPRLAVNDNYFRIDPPPHLQQSWKGNLYADSTRYNITLWSPVKGELFSHRLSGLTNEPTLTLNESLSLSFRNRNSNGVYESLYLLNRNSEPVSIETCCEKRDLLKGDSIRLFNPWQALIRSGNDEATIIIEPDAFMKNYFVNGSRFYVYPLENRFVWARNFSESISVDFKSGGKEKENAVISLDFEIMDSLTRSIENMMRLDTAYGKGAEYGIAIADGNGRLIAIADHIKGLARPDPNDKASFSRTILGENGYISQAVLRKQIGNINLLRMNPGPGSTLKPILFSAIASQLNVDWDNFSSLGFTGEQDLFGGEKVKTYDFELNHGRISSIVNFLKYSDNYYYSNVLLLGSYEKQGLNSLLTKSFKRVNPSSGLHWPNFDYNGQNYWLDGFENWPGYLNGKVNFGHDSSFTSIGLRENFGIFTRPVDKTSDLFGTTYDSILLMGAKNRSGFILPEYSLFDQYGSHVDKRIPYDVFTSCFRGHVKGSSQVLIPPVKMLESFGRLISQSRNYTLTLDPYAKIPANRPFAVENSISYNQYLNLIREGVFEGMKQVLFSGTASALGSMLKKDSPYFYYAKTGTTGDNDSKTKSKLLSITISEKDVTDPDFNFRNNRFYTVYFTLQNGPAKQNEEFIARVISLIERSEVFTKYMKGEK